MINEFYLTIDYDYGNVFAWESLFMQILRRSLVYQACGIFCAFGAMRVFMVVTCYFCITYQCIAIYM